MVQFLSINFFLGFLQFLLGFSKVPVFLCHLYLHVFQPSYGLKLTASSTQFEHTFVSSSIGAEDSVK